jgi:SAM-dependent methyltransferase
MPRRGPPVHRKPLDQSPSKLLAKYAAEIAQNADGLILDVACGYGRNAICLASFDVPVICLDNDALALESVAAENERAGSGVIGLLTTRAIDLQRDAWPYAANSIGAIISVDCVFHELVDRFASSLKIGGYLLIETIDGHGGNYLSLPEPGFFKRILQNTFAFRHFAERRVGPLGANAASTALVAVKSSA